MHPLISTGTLTHDTLDGRVAVVTGAGRGIGLETARSLAWLGARVVIAEIDPALGAEAERLVGEQSGEEAAMFVRTDVSDPASLDALVERVTAEVGAIDIVVNNATVTPFGPVAAVPLAEWDRSYGVNVRGPVALATLAVPGMIERGRGVFVALSSAGGPYMAPYETMKSAQSELVLTLAEELEGTGVFAFAIGPGQVPTPGLAAGVRALAPYYKLDPDEFLALNAANQLTAEEAGAGIAAAIAFAERFHGSETASIAGLNAAGIALGEPEPLRASETPRGDLTSAGQALRDVRTTFAEQLDGWQQRGTFERKWMERDFRKTTRISAEDMLVSLDDLGEALHRGETGEWREVLPALRAYYDRYAQLARDNTKDPDVREAHLAIIGAWIEQIERLERLLGERRG